MTLNESHVEEAALEWFGELGYVVGHGPQHAHKRLWPDILAEYRL